MNIAKNMNKNSQNTWIKTVKKLRIKNIGVKWKKAMLKTVRSAAKKTKIIAFFKHLPWHSRLFLGSKCASLELLLLMQMVASDAQPGAARCLKGVFIA